VLAVDTNVLVRFLTADDPAQAGRARRLVERERVFVGKTVLLETEWVLRGGYGYSRTDILNGLRALLGLANVAVEDPPTVRAALIWCEEGMDFADALHLASSRHCDGMATFDRRFARLAASLDGLPMVEL
jgi:predicted nucleic-acid-binding protein